MTFRRVFSLRGSIPKVLNNVSNNYPSQYIRANNISSNVVIKNKIEEENNISDINDINDIKNNKYNKYFNGEDEWMRQIFGTRGRPDPALKVLSGLALGASVSLLIVLAVEAAT